MSGTGLVRAAIEAARRRQLKMLEAELDNDPWARGYTKARKREPEVVMPRGCQPWGEGLERGGWHGN